MTGFKNNHPPRNIHTRDWSLGTKAVFDQSTAADHEVVAAVAGKKIRILGHALSVADAVDVQWKSAANTISALFQLPSKGIWEPTLPFQQYETNVGEALNINLGAAVRMSGDVWYELVDE